MRSIFVNFTVRNVRHHGCLFFRIAITVSIEKKIDRQVEEQPSVLYGRKV